MGRQQEAIECYVFAMGASPRDERRCHLHRSLCITIGNSNNYVQQQQPRHDRQQHRSGLDGQHGKVSYRNETDCLMSLLSDGGAHCSAVDSAAARLQLGVALLCQEWDVREAWSQVVASTKLRTASAVGGQEGGTTLQLNGRISGFAGTNLGWGAVWLIEAIEGRAQEAAAGFFANATAFGKGWAVSHLRSWRHRLGWKCSGIGMSGIIEGAERLIILHAESMESNNPSQSAASIGALIEHHLALARALLLSGASAEARGHLRSSEQVYLRLGRRLMVRQREGSANNDQDAEPEECVLAENNSASQTEVLKTAIASLHLEIAMLSHTPVVLNSQEEAGALRERFTEELLRMSSRRSSAIFLGDDWKFSNPLAIGVRSQFLLTYQGLDDKDTAEALAVVFGETSGGMLDYQAPRLRPQKPPAGSSSSSSSSHDTDVQQSCDVTSVDRSSDVAAYVTPGQVRQGHDTIADQEPALGDMAVFKESNFIRSENAQGTTRFEEESVYRGERDIVKVGFISSYFRWHSVGRLTVGLLEQLSRRTETTGLQIFIVDTSSSAGEDGDTTTTTEEETSGNVGTQTSGSTPLQGDAHVGGESIIARLSAAGASVTRVNPSATGDPSATEVDASTKDMTTASNDPTKMARETVAALALDVLVFADVGMSALTTALAHSRLAPVQVAFWGHPATTGLRASMDYFVTSDVFEGDYISYGNINHHQNNDQDAGGLSDCRYDTEQKQRRYNRNENSSFGGVGSECTVCQGESRCYREDASSAPADGEGGNDRRWRRRDWTARKNLRDDYNLGRQSAFSEQLVRLGGLGIVFDDPAETFSRPNGRAGKHREAEVSSAPQEPSKQERVQTPQPPRRWQQQGVNVLRSSQGKQVQADIHENSEGDGTQQESAIPIKSFTGGKEENDDETCFRCEAPPAPGASATRTTTPRRENSHGHRRPRLYICAQSLMKMHPSFDHVIAKVLTGDRLAQIILLRDSRQLLWHARFQRRLRTVIDAAEETAGPRVMNHDNVNNSTFAQGHGTGDGGSLWGRVRFVSPMSASEFFALQCRADVVLDPFPFGGGVTIIEALACGTPVVTAGALQSVHRLAEGMIAVIADSKISPEASDAAGGPKTPAGRFAAEVRGRDLSAEGEETTDGRLYDRGSRRTYADVIEDGVQHNAGSVVTAGGLKPGRVTTEDHADDNDAAKHRLDHEVHTIRRRCCHHHSLATTATTTGNDRGHAIGALGNGCAMLVKHLVASSSEEYAEKAIAVAQPGLLRESVVRALSEIEGRDALLRGNGVAEDWEIFLRRATASAASMSVERHE